MAKKKTTVTTTEEETPYEEIHTKTMDELAADKSDETPVEPPKEEKQEPKVEEPKDIEIEFDPDKLKKDAAEEAANKILERLTGTTDKKDETDQELVAPWVKEGRNPQSYDEIADWAVQKKEVLDTRKAAAKEEADNKSRKDKQESAQQSEKQFLDFVDQELNELYSFNQLPKIQDKTNAKDPGVVATNALLETMAQVNAERTTKGEPLIYSINKIFHHYYQPKNSQPAGADAPVSAGNRGGSRDNTDAINYREIHSKSFEQLANDTN